MKLQNTSDMPGSDIPVRDSAVTAYEGCVIFVDDNPGTLDDEVSFVESRNFLVIVIDMSAEGSAVGFRGKVEEALAEAQRHDIPLTKVLISVDTRMSGVAHEISDWTAQGDEQRSENIIDLEAWKSMRSSKRVKPLLGRSGSRVGAFLIEAVFNDLHREHGGFSLLLMSAYKTEGISKRLENLMAEHPDHFFGFAFKFRSEHTTVDTAKGEWSSFLKTLTEGAGRLHSSGSIADRRLAQLHEFLEFQLNDLKSFLMLTDELAARAFERIRLGTSIDVGNLLWHERVEILTDCLIAVEMTTGSIEATKAWFLTPHPHFSNISPKGVLLASTTEELLGYRDFIETEFTFEQ